MNTFTAFRSAWRSLTTNLMRSILTMLGIIIGVAAVITTIAIGNGAQQSVAEQIKGLGTNLLLVMPGAVNASGLRLGAGTGQRLDNGRDFHLRIEEFGGLLVGIGGLVFEDEIRQRGQSALDRLGRPGLALRPERSENVLHRRQGQRGF